MANVIIVTLGALCLIGMVSLDAFITRDISGKRNKNSDNK